MLLVLSLETSMFALSQEDLIRLIR